MLWFEAFENPLNLIKNCFLAFFVELVIMYNKTIVINPVNNQAESVQRDNAFENHVTYVIPKPLCPNPNLVLRDLPSAREFIKALEPVHLIRLYCAMILEKSSFGKVLDNASIGNLIKVTNGLNNDDRRGSFLKKANSNFHQLSFLERVKQMNHIRLNVNLKHELKRVLSILNHVPYSIENDLDCSDLDEALKTCHCQSRRQRQIVLDILFPGKYNLKD